MDLATRTVFGLLMVLLLGGSTYLVFTRVDLPGINTPPTVAIHEYPRESARNCYPAVFYGLGPSGNGTLPISTGPSAAHRVRGELEHGDTFLVFEYHGGWAGIVYGHNREVCGALHKREVTDARQGWVPADWVSYLPN